MFRPVYHQQAIITKLTKGVHMHAHFILSFLMWLDEGQLTETCCPGKNKNTDAYYFFLLLHRAFWYM